VNSVCWPTGLAGDGYFRLERRLLKANLDWLLAVPADMATLRSRLKDVDGDQQTACELL
jgi:hypothetical protein